MDKSCGEEKTYWANGNKLVSSEGLVHSSSTGI